MVPVLELNNICKSFPGVKALDDVSITLFSGETHILAGENGAGKSTLMKVLSGVYKPDNGELVLSGRKTRLNNPREAEDCGIRMIYQEFNLIAELSVAANIFLGHERYKRSLPGVLDQQRMHDETERLLSRLNVDIEPDAKIKDLGVGEQQMIEIAKALSVNARILVFDEPTSSLTNRETQELFRLINVLKEDGVGIFYISHRLEESFEIGDRVTILRDGKVIDTKAVEDISMNELIEKIANRNINNLYPKESVRPGDVVLDVVGLTNKNFKDINLKVRAGEIVGLAGLVGAGRTELACSIFGIDAYDDGEIRFLGERITQKDPHRTVDAGISLLPEDRKNLGLALDLSIKDNVVICSLDKCFPSRYIKSNKEDRIVNKYVDDLKIATSSIKKIAKKLSGGTQQKVVVSKWLLTEAKLLIFDEPTRGIDVGTKTEIYRLMSDLAKKGAAILMISSDLPEILGMSDRVYVMAHGRITGEFDSSKTTQAEVLKCAFMQTSEDAHAE